MLDSVLMAPFLLVSVLTAGSIYVIKGADPGVERRHVIRIVITFYVPIMLLVVYYVTLLINTTG